MEGWVTAPSMEVADDLDELRLGVHQRWQTKRGPADNPHILDWIEFDTDITFFPNPNRDNFGTTVGLTDYNFIWHVGDRLTVLSNGIFDFFGEGQKIVTMGMFLTRPPRGSLYLGFSVLEGPISSDVLTMSYSYWMSPKWITSSGMTIDLKEPKNFGPTFQIRARGRIAVDRHERELQPRAEHLRRGLYGRAAVRAQERRAEPEARSARRAGRRVWSRMRELRS